MGRGDTPGGGEARRPVRDAGRSLRILLVEDNVDVAGSLKLLLELEGHSASVARTGEEALEEARKAAEEAGKAAERAGKAAERVGGRPFDLILCDIHLSGPLDGYAVARAFRADPSLAEISLAAVTGYGQERDRRDAAEAGFDFHLTKPVELPTLRSLLARLGA